MLWDHSAGLDTALQGASETPLLGDPSMAGGCVPCSPIPPVSSAHPQALSLLCKDWGREKLHLVPPPSFAKEPWTPLPVLGGTGLGSNQVPPPFFSTPTVKPLGGAGKREGLLGTLGGRLEGL